MRNKKYYNDFKLTLESDRVDTHIGSSVVIQGPVSTKKDIRIEGSVKGDVSAKGNVFIGTYSVIDGNVKGKHVTVCGKVNGDVSARGRIIVSSKACINGNLSMENLVMDEGAVFNGISSMRGAKPEAESIKPDSGKESDDDIVIEIDEK